MTSTYVQYGCGLAAPENWVNFDASPSLVVQRLPVLGKIINFSVEFPQNVKFGDIRRGLPIPDGSCDAIYCSHVLEHLALEDFRKALSNTYKHLRPGGVFRLVVPDLEILAKTYLQSSGSDPDAAGRFMRESFLGLEHRERGLVALLRAAFGNSRHLWMWDYRSLEGELRKVGFTNIRRADFGDSGDSMFSAVENPLRWENCLGVQCER